MPAVGSILCQHSGVFGFCGFRLKISETMFDATRGLFLSQQQSGVFGFVVSDLKISKILMQRGDHFFDNNQQCWAVVISDLKNSEKEFDGSVAVLLAS